MKILLTNDDGVYGHGLRALVRELVDRADLLVVAPEGPRSASSHSITLHKPLRLFPVRLPELGSQQEKEERTEAASNENPGANAQDQRPRAEVYACSGSPTDCVILALLHILKGDKPDLLISGINGGSNIGEDVSYSGTVSAAMEGALYDVPSVAISLDLRERMQFDVAARFVAENLERLATMKKSGIRLLNINVPDIPYEKIAGVKATILDSRKYDDVVRVYEDPSGEPFYWIGGDKVPRMKSEETDVWALRNDYISVTPLLLDHTDYGALERTHRIIASLTRE